MANVMESVAVISAAVATVKSLKWYSEYAHEKHIRQKRQAFRLYVETGEKNQAYFSLSRGAIKAARRQRLRIINAKTEANRQFTALTECPQCCSFDVHYIKAKLFIRCVRECKDCSYQWRQDK